MNSNSDGQDRQDGQDKKYFARSPFDKLRAGREGANEEKLYVAM